MSEPNVCGAAMDWCEVRRHERALLSDIKKAHVGGHIKRADYLTRRYLASRDARLIATKTAFKALPLHRRPPKSKLSEIVDSLSAWRGSDERVAFGYKLKNSNPYKFRTVMDFGIEHRAL